MARAKEGSTNRFAYAVKAPETGINVAISPKDTITENSRLPTNKYARRQPTGPAFAKALPLPINSPVPTAPPIYSHLMASDKTLGTQAELAVQFIIDMPGWWGSSVWTYQLQSSGGDGFLTAAGVRCFYQRAVPPLESPHFVAPYSPPFVSGYQK